MKKTFLIFLFLSIMYGSFAQITITNADMPVSGDTLRFSTTALTDTALLNNNYKDGGANMLWNFSGIKPQEQGVDTFKPQNQTPYKLAFFGRYGLKQPNVLILTDVYNFFENTTTSFNIMGKGLSANLTTAIQLTGNYSVKDKVYQFPLDYGDRDSSNFSVSATALGVATFTSDGYRINEVDGWGTIKTPFGTFSCLRVKTTYYSNDTFSQTIIPFPIGINSRQVEYKWLAKGQHIPVLEVTGTVNGTGVFTITKIRFRDKKRNVVSPNAPKANFIADKTNPTNIETVTFTNQTTATGFPQPTFLWSFTPADFQFTGNTTATSRNPKVIFTKPGLYSVKLSATNSFGSDDTIRVNYIKVSRNTLNLPVAAFTADKTTPVVTDTVHFTNSSTVAVASKYLWSVTPSTYTFINSDDTFPSPSIKFYGAGKYTISLMVTNFYGSDTLVKQDYITAKYPTGISSVPDFLNKYYIYPNPLTSGNVHLVFDIQRKSKIIAELFDIKGAKISGLVNTTFQSGTYNLSFDLSAFDLTNSAYLVRLTDDQGVHYLKLFLSK
jgi:PKD repeat protein